MSMYYCVVYNKYTKNLTLHQNVPNDFDPCDKYSGDSIVVGPTPSVGEVMIALVREINDLRGSLNYMQERG